MKRWLFHYRIVVGAPDALARRLREELPELLARALGQEPNPPLADGSFLVELGTEVVGVTRRSTSGSWSGTSSLLPAGPSCR